MALDRLAVEELLHQVLPRLARVGDRAGGGGPARPKEVGLEPVDADRRTALEQGREGHRVCVGACDSSHREGALRMDLTGEVIDMHLHLVEARRRHGEAQQPVDPGHPAPARGKRGGLDQAARAHVVGLGDLADLT